MHHTFPDLDAVGVKADPETSNKLGRKVAKLLRQAQIGFPGAAPLSFSSRHLAELQREDYYVCEKTDGIRCLMYFDSELPEAHYLIDRKNDYRYVPRLQFPKPGDNKFLSFHVDTVIDGELVIDTYEDGSQQLKYLVFDCLALDGHNVMDHTFDKRLAYFMTEILKPHNDMLRMFPENKEHRPFLIEAKPMHFSYNIEMMFREIIPEAKRLHGNDGLIFTCRATPYYIGLDEHILKWKHASDNTVDFRLNLQFPGKPDSKEEASRVTEPGRNDDAIPICHLSVMLSPGNYRPFGEMYVTQMEWDNLRAMDTPLDNAVVECHKDDQARWRFYRLRKDKADGNPITVVEKTIKSMDDCITEEDLIHAAPAIEAAWKRRQDTIAPANGSASIEPSPFSQL
ncbi:mRNA capping enzyme, catalytic domain-containing protein [Aspergillus pseudotamarii]|uniref:mRNA-capping enzyme subunit alpha n=1 Tax=Aspergillus pseudotamarii TaxID=132259 RepID=A0A5N6SGD9_ASPPS|nr:mRNA capping enzyme, catalytic domain-containing protein [Aspergillus pseudotamarii]KAE8133786.1 mRNA capping enzyme, catalytic domain-containing protein [Aspergillus pseudotamarii]